MVGWRCVFATGIWAMKPVTLITRIGAYMFKAPSTENGTRNQGLESGHAWARQICKPRRYRGASAIVAWRRVQGGGGRVVERAQDRLAFHAAQRHLVEQHFPVAHFGVNSRSQWGVSPISLSVA